MKVKVYKQIPSYIFIMFKIFFSLNEILFEENPSFIITLRIIKLINYHIFENR